MKAMRFIRGVLLLMWFLPWIAQASDADTFTAANRTQQAALLEQWAVNPDVQRIPLLSALRDENLLTDNAKNTFIMNGSHAQPLGTATIPNGELKKIRLTNRLRNLAAGALASYLLGDSVLQFSTVIGAYCISKAADRLKASQGCTTATRIADLPATWASRCSRRCWLWASGTSASAPPSRPFSLRGSCRNFSGAMT